MRVDGQGHRNCIGCRQLPVLRPLLGEQSEEQSARNESTQQQARVAARVLREPDVMVGEREQRGREEGFPPRGHQGAEPVQGPETRDTQQRSRQTQCPRTLSEEGHRAARQRRVQEVLVLTVERRHDPSQREAHISNQGPDFVKPETIAEIVEA